jgi:hypothetical protein
MIRGAPAFYANNVDGILLQDSPGSRVERSYLYVGGDSSDLAVRGVRVTGAAAGIVIRANTLETNAPADSGYPQPYPERAVLSFAECAGAAPWVADNESIALSGSLDGDAILATGDCHPVIENVGTVSVKQYRAMNTRGIQCRAGTVPSRCTIAQTHVIGNIVGFSHSTTLDLFFSNTYGTGILCQGQSCQTIRGNTVTGVDASSLTCQSHCNLFATAVSLDGGRVEVRDNELAPGHPLVAQSFSLAGLDGTTTESIVGNQLSGLANVEASRFENNTCDSDVRWSGDGGIVLNNCFQGVFADAGPGHGPQEFTNNHLGPLSDTKTCLYADGSSNLLTTIDEVNALTDMVSAGNDTSCP